MGYRGRGVGIINSHIGVWGDGVASSWDRKNRSWGIDGWGVPASAGRTPPPQIDKVFKTLLLLVPG